MAAKPKVKIYSTPTCVYCGMAKEFLNEHKIPFQNVDVSEDSKAAEEMIKKSGQMGVPVLEIGKEIMVGYDLARIKKALKLK